MGEYAKCWCKNSNVGEKKEDMKRKRVEGLKGFVVIRKKRRRILTTVGVGVEVEFYFDITPATV